MIEKVKAHATRAERGTMSIDIFEGSKQADAHAKMGARLLEHPDWHRQTYIDRCKLVTGIIEFAAKVSSLSGDVEDTTKAAKADEDVLELVADHEFQEPNEEDDVICLGDVETPAMRGVPRGPIVLDEDSQSAEEDQVEAEPEPEAPQGSELGPEQQLREQNIAAAKRNGHHIIVRSTHVFCSRCAYYAVKRWKMLITKSCPGPIGLTCHLNRLWDGRNPATNKRL